MHEALTYAVLVTVCFCVPTLLLTRGSELLFGDRGLITRLVARLSEREPALDDDDLAVLAAWAYRRSQQISAALERLRRILATDASMSATRQLANRMAYAQLQQDLRRVPDVAWPEYSVPVPVMAGSIRSLPGRPDVELLDVGFSWRAAA